jgi:hypothetical protein
MNSKISDTALDLGVFALDSEIENSAIPYPISDRSKAECFAVAS